MLLFTPKKIIKNSKTTFGYDRCLLCLLSTDIDNEL